MEVLSRACTQLSHSWEKQIKRKGRRETRAGIAVRGLEAGSLGSEEPVGRGAASSTAWLVPGQPGAQLWGLQ